MLFTGFPWNPMGVVWLGVPWVAQGARWVGTYGLSAVAVLVASLIAFGVRAHWRATAILSLGLALLFVPFARTASGRDARAPKSTILVRVVQPDIAQDEKYGPAEAERNERLYAKLSGTPTSTPRLLLWPEAATLRFLEWEPSARAKLASLLGPRDLLLLGGESAIPDSKSGELIYHNSVFALDSRGALLWRYDKAHLVPFGEYLPLRRFLEPLGLARLVPGDGDFTPGSGARTFPLAGFGLASRPSSVGVQICYEIIFSGRVIDEKHRPSFLFNPSNDAWFGAWGPPQHLAQARLRAIEEGLPVIRATPNGISALIDPRGHLVATVPRHHAGVIDAYLPAPLPPTAFSTLGLWASALLGLTFGTTGLVAAAIGRRRPPPRHEPADRQRLAAI